MAVLYARVLNGVVERVSPDPGTPPPEGWLPLIRTPRPADTATTTFDRVLTVGPTSVSEGWAERPLTAEEATTRARSTRAEAIDGRVDAALTANLAWLGRTAAPTNALVLEHIDRLTRQVNGLIRHVFDRLDSTEGTGA